MIPEFKTDFELYKIFYITALEGNFTQAARQLFLTQPSITKHIRNLETALGCTLFLRSKNGVSLTNEGKTLFKYIEPVCNQIIAAEKELDSLISLNSGEISIVSSEMGYKSYVFPVIEIFKKKYPDIVFKFENVLNDKMMDMLISGRTDIAIIHSPFTIGENLKYEVINEVHEVMVCAKFMSKEFSGRKITPEELCTYQIATMPYHSSTYDYFNDYFLRFGLEFNPTIVLSTLDLTIHAVEQGLAIGIIPEKFANPLIKEGKLSRIQLQYPLPVRQACLITNATAPLSVAANAFVNELKAYPFKHKQ